MTIQNQDEIWPIDPNTIEMSLEEIEYLNSIKERIPRLGRRDSLPHTNQIEYIGSVLKANFPNDTVLTDLWHYFQVGNYIEKFVPDIAFYKDFKLDNLIKSYKSIEHNNKIPLVVINMMSHSTWKNDVSEIVQKCLRVGIAFYIIYTMYSIDVEENNPPFLRIYEYNEERGEYDITEIREYAKYEEKEEIDESKIYSNERLPFRVGLEKTLGKSDGERVSRLLIIDKKELKKLLSMEEIEIKKAKEAEYKAEEERKKVEEERKKAEEERKKREEAENQIKKMEEILNKYRQKFGNI